MARLLSRGPLDYLRATLIAIGLGLIVSLFLTEGDSFIRGFTTIGDHITNINKHYAEIVRAVFRIAGIVIFFWIAVVLLLAGIRMKSSSPFLRRDIIDIILIVLKAMRMLIILLIIQELIFMLISGEAPVFALRPNEGPSVLASCMALLLDFALLAFCLMLPKYLRQAQQNIN